MKQTCSNLRVPKGVTLVELMVAIALIGILAAVASPSIYRAMERANARGVATEVANQMRTARNQAMSRGEPIWVTLAERNPGTTEGGFVALWRQTGVETATACADGFCGAGAMCKCPLSKPDCARAERVCFTDVPRSCREGFNVNNWRMLASQELSLLDSTYSLQEVEPTENCPIQMYFPTTTNSVPCDLTICMEPDGRVLRSNGLSLSQLPASGSQVCDEEDLVVFTAPDSATLPSLDCTTTPITRAAQIESFDVNLVHKISVPYSGAIKVIR